MNGYHFYRIIWRYGNVYHYRDMLSGVNAGHFTSKVHGRIYKIKGEIPADNFKTKVMDEHTYNKIYKR